MIVKLLTDIHSSKECIDVAKQKWLEDLLSFIGINVVELNALSPSKAMEHLLFHQVNIYDYPSLGAIKVEYRFPESKNYETIGEWAGAEYVLKREQGKMFYEISIECWSIIDDGMDVS